ncbi:hypothetical protein AB0O76_04795 [Streptomyces sp. NPDC086554]|uniref:hypothetical protein n=1 Tax=Streptomyces sp. NPDC086554 TaxID=3154864 RepID=UPI00341E6E28
MRRTTIAALLTASVLALAGCSDDGETDAAAKPKPKATPTQTTPDTPSVPSPNAAQTKALTDALSAIKPELAADEERAVRRAQNVCMDVKGGKDAATMAKNANARYSGGTAGQLTDAQGAQIVKAVKDTFCS